MSGMDIRDVRMDMPHHPRYQDRRRDGDVTGIAIHHSATANRVTGVCMDDASSVFNHHVHVLGWEHGGYHYLVRPNGVIEYALDEAIPAFHAGFRDPANALNLEHGQYWNNHLLAICVLGWFECDRTVDGGTVKIPDRFTVPTPRQVDALIGLLRDMFARYGIGPDSVKGHRELAGCSTRCPGANVDLDALRDQLRQAGRHGAI